MSEADYKSSCINSYCNLHHHNYRFHHPQHPAPHFHHHHYHSHVHILHHHRNWTTSGAFPAGEVVRSAGGLHQASAFGAQGDADGGGNRGGVCSLLAAVLHHQHGQSGGHHPRVQRHCRHLLLCRHPVLR